jgi:hypothetical protein
LSGRYRAGSGRWVVPGKQLGNDGAAGSAWTVEGDDSVVLKLLSKLDADDEPRLKAMLNLDVPTRLSGAETVIAWPEDILFDEDGRYVGFLMPTAPGPEPLTLASLVPRSQREQKVGKNFGWDGLLEICARYAAGIEALHAFPIVVSDINLKNAVASGDLTVTVIDCDSIQLETPERFFGSRYSQPEFVAPELAGIEDIAAHHRDQATDRWSLAVLIWMLLMEGFHPFAGVWSGPGEDPTPAENAAAGRFPYAMRSALAPPAHAPPWRALPRNLQKLFVTAFTDGVGRPKRRPTATEWRQALVEAKGKLKECDGKFGRRHRYPARESSCPWCEYEGFLTATDLQPVQPPAPPQLLRTSEVPAAVGHGGMRVLAGGAACLALTLALALLTTFNVGVRFGIELAAAWHLVWLPVAIVTGAAWAGSIVHDVIQARGGERFWWESIQPVYLGVAVAAVGGAFAVGAVSDGAIPPSAWSLFPAALCAGFLVALLANLLVSRVPRRAVAIVVALAGFLAVTGAAWAAAARSDLPSRKAESTVDRRLAAVVPLGHCHPRAVAKLPAGLLRNSLDGVVFCHSRHIAGRFLAFADDDLLDLYGAEQEKVAAGRDEIPANRCNSHVGAYADSWFQNGHPNHPLGRLVCFGRRERGVLKWEDPRDDLFGVIRGAGRRPDYTWWRTHQIHPGWRRGPGQG